jgi:hypothetical protein
MSDLTLRERVIREIFELDDDNVESLLAYIKTLRSLQLPADDDPDHDPMIGMYEGEPDLAARSEEILQQEFERRR